MRRGLDEAQGEEMELEVNPRRGRVGAVRIAVEKMEAAALEDFLRIGHVVGLIVLDEPGEAVRAGAEVLARVEHHDGQQQGEASGPACE